MSPLSYATYEVTATSGTPVVTRSLEFENGDKISFSIAVPNGNYCSLVELHRVSALYAIELLQGWLKPERTEPAKKASIAPLGAIPRR